MENNFQAIRNAKLNATINKITNVEFVLADVKTILKNIKPNIYQTVILDPPRMGCEPEVIKELLRVKPGNIIYISCFPETLVNDLRQLIKEGYQITYCQPIDMFPHTYHMEIVVKLELK